MTDHAAILCVPSDGALAAEFASARAHARLPGENPADAAPSSVLFDFDAFDDPCPRIAELRELHPQASVLVVSGHQDPSHIVDALRAGAHDWVPRPVEASRLGDTLERAELRRELARDREQMVRTLEAHGRRVEGERLEWNERLASLAADLEATHRQLEAAHHELRGRVAQLTTLYRIGRDLSAQRNWDEALDNFLTTLCRFLDAPGAALLLSSDSGQRLTARSVRGLDDATIDGAIETLRPRALANKGDARLLPLSESSAADAVSCVEMESPWRETVLPLCHRGQELGYLLLEKGYSSGSDLEADFYFLITIQTVLAEEVASAQAFGALRRLQRFQARTLDHLSSGVLTVDAQGRVTSENAKAREMLGTLGPGEELAPVLRIEGADTALGPWLAARAATQTVSCDGWIRRGDRESAVPVSIVASPVPGDLAEHVQIVCVIEDQAQRHALESERRRAARQNELLIMAAEWAHDVRTPLTGILHGSELLAEALPKDSPKRRHFQLVRGEVDRIEKLVSHFLDFARPVTPKRVKVDLLTLARESVQLLEGPARQRGRTLRIRAASANQDFSVRADADMLKQVLLNLISNALDATPEGSDVEVALEQRGEDEDILAGQTPVAVVEVRDQGPGVVAEYIDRLFVPFFTTKQQGTGLGLAISDKIVRAHEGHLRYDRRDATTILRMVLPLDATVRVRERNTADPDGLASELEARG